jgi:hypothetical protein
MPEFDVIDAFAQDADEVVCPYPLQAEGVMRPYGLEAGH